jgi:hypothetical protein
MHAVSFVLFLNTINIQMNTTQEKLTGFPISDLPENTSLIPDSGFKEKFYPSGAIAFFIALLILCLVIWFGIYFLMLERI